MIIKQKGGDIVSFLQKKINPPEMHIPGYQFCGPFTKLEKRLARGDQGINRVDEICRKHDISYSKTDNTSERHIADSEMLKQLDEIENPSFGETASRAVIKPIMRSKVRFGLGVQAHSPMKTIPIINMQNIYCVKCRSKTNSNDLKEITNKKGRPMLAGICTVCGIKKFTFIKKN